MKIYPGKSGKSIRGAIFAKNVHGRIEDGQGRADPEARERCHVPVFVFQAFMPDKLDREALRVPGIGVDCLQ